MIKVDGKMGVIEFKNGRPKLLRGVKSGYRVAVSFIQVISQSCVVGILFL